MTRRLKEDFLQHCRDNNLAGVTDCLSRGVDVNTVSEDGRWSGLTIAAEKNYPELLEILLSHPDVEMNITTDLNRWGSRTPMTALMFACEAGNSDIVSRLVQEPGVDLNYEDEFGETAAHQACRRSRVECVRILAETGRVDWNKGNMRDMIPLYWALEAGCSGIVDIIVKQPNIDWNYRIDFDDDGDTLAHAALMGGDEKCVETLAALEIFDCWNLPNKDGDTPVMGAVKRNWTEIVEILLRCPRVDLNCRDKKGWSLVFRAVQCGNFGE